MVKSVVLVCIVTLIVVNFVSATEDDESLLCCPSSTFILGNACYDPANHTRGPMRIACNIEWGNISYSNYNVSGGKIAIKFSPMLTHKFSSHEACYGNETRDVNLTHFRRKVTICIIKDLEDMSVANNIFIYCTIMSVVFLILAALIYAAFHELRDLFGTSAINFCGSLAIGLGIYIILRLTVPENMALCATKGFLAYFFLMAAFFWTNSISIQVLRDTRRPCAVDYGWSELKWYMLYSWGSPTILTTIMAIVNYHPGDHDRPGIGHSHCWFNPYQQWYYMYSVITILLLINFAIFIYIAIIIWRSTLSSTPIKALKFKLSMSFRLILLMGLPWTFEMVVAAVNAGYTIIIIKEILISVQGILIFLVLVARKRVVKVMHKRGLLDWCSGPVERWLAVGDDAETNVVQHTDVPMHDDRLTNGYGRQ